MTGETVSSLIRDIVVRGARSKLHELALSDEPPAPAVSSSPRAGHGNPVDLAGGGRE